MKPAHSCISATPSHVLIFSTNAVDTVACLTCVPIDEPAFSYLSYLHMVEHYSLI
jgi:hypothetical protein